MYGQSRKGKLKAWRQAHPSYWKAWRKKHPGYVGRNRKAQIRRNAKNRGMIAKPTAWNAVSLEKLGRIGALRVIAKPTEWGEVYGQQIDGILKYLKREVLIAKPTDMDRGH